MQPFVANTDRTWFDFLALRASAAGGTLDEVNFWQPMAQRPIARLAPGTPFFFRLKSPVNAVAGYGFYSSFTLLRLDQAWDSFGPANGDADFLGFLGRIGEFRGEDLTQGSLATKPIGCTILRDAVYWPESRWLPWGRAEGWAPNIVQGKTERDPVRASRLLGEIQFDHLSVPEDLIGQPFHPLEVDERELVLARTLPRVGQGAFRSRLLDAYDRQCAITGEHTEIVLDAAHIQPYLGPRSNHVQNGLLLTKEFHTLFDRGFVTITPEHRVRVSPRLREEWDNGRRYYEFDGRELARVPEQDMAPSQDVLAWHGERVFRT